jgi:23S rRNA pseudouridine2605 synthase
VDLEYAVRVLGDVDDATIKRLKEGIMLDDGVARFTDIQPAGGEGCNKWFHVVLMEGRNREVRRLWESQGIQVSRLKRVRYGCLFLSSKLKTGVWQELNQKDVNELRALVDLPPVRVPRKTIQELLDAERLQRKTWDPARKHGPRSAIRKLPAR